MPPPPHTPFRRLFLLAGWTHLLCGMAGLIVLPSLFRQLGMARPAVPFFWQFSMAALACFGLAGLWTARDPRRNRDLIQLWLCVKTAAAVLALWNIRLHGLRPVAGLLVVVDAVWIAAFTSVLVRLGPNGPRS